MRRAFLLTVGVLLVAAPPTLVQQRTHVVRGVVFDSVARAPLAGAVVQVASRESLSRPFTTTTDATGRFRVGGLPSGRFVIGFYHEALRALGLDAPRRALELAADSNVTLDLAVPSGAVVRALRCGGDSSVDRDGLLAGFVRDAVRDGVRDEVRDEALTGATVVAEWKAVVLDPGNFHQEVQRVRATVGANGTYAACGLPVDVALTFRVTAPGRRTIDGQIVVPASGAKRQDFRLGDSAVVRGEAVLTGRVSYENGRPLHTGRVTIAALAREVPLVNGAFTMSGLPPGTWLAEVRAIGLAPQAQLVDAVAGESAPASITVTDRPPLLDAVTVIGERSYNSTLVDDIIRRHRASAGKVFLPGNTWLKGALYVADVLRVAPGFRYNSPDVVYGRSTGQGDCSATVFLDGMPILGGFRDLNAIIDVRDVLAIEAFPDMLFAPPQWQKQVIGISSKGTPVFPCAIVLVWLKR